MKVKLFGVELVVNQQRKVRRRPMLQWWRLTERASDLSYSSAG
jgi:hypothetical protein